MNLDFSKLEGFEWDLGNLEHIKKHSVSYKECEEVFFRKTIVLHDHKHSIYEERFKVFGITSKGREIILVMTVRGKNIRVLTARDQSKKERGVLKL